MHFNMRKIRKYLSNQMFHPARFSNNDANRNLIS